MTTSLHTHRITAPLPGLPVSTPLATRLRQLASRLAQAVSGSVDRLQTWPLRAQARRDLLELSDRTLLDVGLTRAEVLREANKPFWTC